MCGGSSSKRDIAQRRMDSREAMLLELIQRIHSEQRATVQMLEAHTPLDLERALDLITELVVRHGAPPNS